MFNLKFRFTKIFIEKCEHITKDELLKETHSESIAVFLECHKHFLPAWLECWTYSKNAKEFMKLEKKLDVNKKDKVKKKVERKQTKILDKNCANIKFFLKEFGSKLWKDLSHENIVRGSSEQNPIRIYNMYIGKLDGESLYKKVFQSMEVLEDDAEVTSNKLENSIHCLTEENENLEIYIRFAHRETLVRVRQRLKIAKEKVLLNRTMLQSLQNRLDELKEYVQRAETERINLNMQKEEMRCLSALAPQIERIYEILSIMDRISGDLQRAEQEMSKHEFFIEKIDDADGALKLAIKCAPCALVIKREHITKVSAVVNNSMENKNKFDRYYNNYLACLEDSIFDNIREQICSVTKENVDQMNQSGETQFALKEDEVQFIKLKEKVSRERDKLETTIIELKDALKQNQCDLKQACTEYNEFTNENSTKIGEFGTETIDFDSENNENFKEKVEILRGKIRSKCQGYEVEEKYIEEIRNLYYELLEQWNGDNSQLNYNSFRKDDIKFGQVCTLLKEKIEENEIALKTLRVTYKDKEHSLEEVLIIMLQEVARCANEAREIVKMECEKFFPHGFELEDKFWTNLRNNQNLDTIFRYSNMVASFDALNVMELTDYKQIFSIIQIKDPKDEAFGFEFLRGILINRYIYRAEFFLSGEPAYILYVDKSVTVINVIEEYAKQGEYVWVHVKINSDGMLTEAKKRNSLANFHFMRNYTKNYFKYELTNLKKGNSFEDFIIAEYKSKTFEELTISGLNMKLNQDIGYDTGLPLRYPLLEFEKRKTQKIEEAGVTILNFGIGEVVE